MTKHTKIKAETAEYAARLEEIARMSFGELSDDDIAALLAERKHLFASQRADEERRRVEAERAALEQKQQEEMKMVQKKKSALADALQELNRSISPDKNDEELLLLIAKRKTLEKQLQDVAQERQQPDAAVAVGSVRTEPEIVDETVLRGSGAAPDSAVSVSAAQQQEAKTMPTLPVPGIKGTLVEDFGREAITRDDFSEGSTFHRYLEQLKNNTGSLGTLLQEMPADAKKNKAFMLKVADIDPAYAMHYADTDTLKRDEGFNIRIASIKNPRNSGNAIAEMLPEARTSKVILAAVKQDYRNVRFVRPDMEEYDEILRIAKQAALEQVAHLKEAADVTLLIPKLLQNDKQFMQEVENITAFSGKQKAAA